MNSLVALSEAAGTGMTSLSTSTAGWRNKIEETQDTINGRTDIGTYFLVLEDLSLNRIIGTTAVYTGVGIYRPYYAYQRKGNFLEPVPAFTGSSEIGSLFLSKEGRRPGLGKALAQSRYVLMKQFPKLFQGEVMAVCRGWLRNNQSPVWSETGEQFTECDFSLASIKASKIGTEWIAEAVPDQFTISDSIGSLLGKAHKNSVPAMQMLLKENFTQTEYYDILDGGPMFSCQVNDIESVNQVRSVRVEVGSGNAWFIVAGGDINHYQMFICQGTLINNTLKVSPTTHYAINTLLRHTNISCLPLKNIR